MKIVCTKKELAEGLQKVMVAISPKTTLPVLSNFLIECEKNRVKFVATDLEIGLRCYIQAEIKEEGAVSVPAKQLSEIVRELRGDDVRIESDSSNRVILYCAKTKYILMGLPKEDYPVLPEFKEDKTINLTVAMLKEMLTKTAFGMSSDETRYVLNGIYLIITENDIRMVSTDGRRLAFVSRKIQEKKTPASVIIPSKAVVEVLHLLETADKDKKVKIIIGDNQITFKIEDTIFLSRSVEGEFPNYERVIPQKQEIKIQIDKEEMLSATKQIALMCADKGGSIKYLVEKNLLHISANTPGKGEGETEVEIEYSGKQVEVALNPLYVIDVLKVLDTDKVQLEFSGSLNPSTIRPANDDSYVCVIMPMRVM